MGYDAGFVRPRDTSPAGMSPHPADDYMTGLAPEADYGTRPDIVSYYVCDSPATLEIAPAAHSHSAEHMRTNQLERAARLALIQRVRVLSKRPES